MNQHQRKFLLEEIQKRYKDERNELVSRKPTEPSLNNYLVAAILDGSAVMRPQEELREEIRRRVRDMSKDSALVSNKGRWGTEKAEDEISLPALLLFQEPPGFVEVRTAYEEALKAWETEMDALEASVDAMRIKIQVGSDKALESLVKQADSLCSMSLTSASRLLLPSGFSNS